ncbi:MAG: signal recognition particle-docking protein FtsY [Acidimicrobiales bacterium mtb01]|nr:signal recognition particle-docking protein FtsY [Actinomycetota bacterium]TEX45562.1 MAG: signal recognition particle-docking protein FtsY [Acidimicrobiales bacterium mtb01]
MNAQTLIIILLVVAVVFGLGVVVVSRRRSMSSSSSSSSSVGTAMPEIRTAPPRIEPPVLAPVPEPIVVEPVVEPAPEQIVVEPLVEERTPSFRERMGKAAAAMAGVLGGVRSRQGIGNDTWDDLEEALLRADVGIGVTTALLDGLRERVKSKAIQTPDELIAALAADMTARLHGADRSLRFDESLASAGRVNVWLFVGVNGVGKTTTIGKVAAQQMAGGRSVILAAGDTFRAAAAEQLGTWADRSGAELVRGAEGGDPSSVIYDGVQRANAKGVALVLGDTAGRLQNKSNLIEELRKVRRVASKDPGEVTEVLLVIDATTGQNGLAQAREFTEAAGVTGVVLTKLDGSAKGGIVFAIETELGLPVKLVGLGETIADLVQFDPNEFVGALLDVA